MNPQKFQENVVKKEEDTNASNCNRPLTIAITAYDFDGKTLYNNKVINSTFAKLNKFLKENQLPISPAENDVCSLDFGKSKANKRSYWTSAALGRQEPEQDVHKLTEPPVDVQTETNEPNILDVENVTKSKTISRNVKLAMLQNVFARWRDKNYYPGIVEMKSENDTWQIRWDSDGTVDPVSEAFILPIKILETGTKVYVGVQNCCHATKFDPDMGEVRDCNLVQNTMTKSEDINYLIRLKDQQDVWYSAKDISIPARVAQNLRENEPRLKRFKYSYVNPDNIVTEKRRMSKSNMTSKSDVEDEQRLNMGNTDIVRSITSPDFSVSTLTYVDLDITDDYVDEGSVEAMVLDHSSKPLIVYQGVPIYEKDVMCLTETHFLNDAIINFWMLYIMQHKDMRPTDRKQVHIFSTYFYESLSTNQSKDENTNEETMKSKDESPAHQKYNLSRNEANAVKRHARVKRWTKGIDIFEKDFIVIPINMRKAHWYMAVVCYPGLVGVDNLETMGEHNANYNQLRGNEKGEIKINNNPDIDIRNDITPKTNCNSLELGKDQRKPCIIIFDSLAEAEATKKHRDLVLTNIREYLKLELKTRKNVERIFSLPAVIANVPQQTNHWDCGIYTLLYFESFVKSPIQVVDTLNEDGSLELTSLQLKGTRKEIYAVLAELVTTHNPIYIKDFPKLQFNA